MEIYINLLMLNIPKFLGRQNRDGQFSCVGKDFNVTNLQKYKRLMSVNGEL